MRGRLTVLLVIAVSAGTIAGTVGKAAAGKTRAIPVAPRTQPTRARLAASRIRFAACPVPREYRSAFRAAADQTGLPTSMLVAVAMVESNLEQRARSSAGALGLLQLLPSTARSLELDPSRVRTNVLAGARYLRSMLDRFQSADLALAAYNAGPTAVDRAGGPPSRQTAAYVENVTELWRALAGCR